LAAWQDFWSSDVGSREVPRVLQQWAEIGQAASEAGIAKLRAMTEQMQQKHGVKELGPDWEVLGAGDAYVRALAAEGKPVAPEQLRQQAPPEGSFVILRQGQMVQGYAVLVEALRDVQEDDIIEIRRDGEFAGLDIQAPLPVPVTGRKLTIRAAPGYRPVHVGATACGSEWQTLTFEGIHFSQRKPKTYTLQTASPLRLVNCSFEERALLDSLILYHRAPLEIVNCVIPGRVHQGMTDLHKEIHLTVRNSIIGAYSLGTVPDSSAAVVLERSVLWAPLWHCFDVRPPTGDGKKSRFSFTVRHCLFLADSVTHIPFLGQFTWEATGNVYRIGGGYGFSTPEYTDSLVDLRRQLGSDVDSAEDDAIDFDPQMWRLLPASPGYREGPGGKDYGADVDRILQPQPQ
jgi:hypothetical protein